MQAVIFLTCQLLNANPSDWQAISEPLVLAPGQTRCPYLLHAGRAGTVYISSHADLSY